jgi:hypothetical protein
LPHCLVVAEFQDLLEVCDGLCCIPLVVVGLPPEAVGLGEIGLQRNGLVVVLDGLVIVALAGVGVSPVAVGQGVIGFELDGLVVVRDGPVIVALMEVGVPRVVAGRGETQPTDSKLVTACLERVSTGTRRTAAACVM